MRHFRQSLSLLFAITLVTGVVYPAMITALAQIFFPKQANGSLVYRDGHLIGSEWIGQEFTSREYFWGRPSATGPSPYNAGASSGSNFGPLNDAMIASAKKRYLDLQREPSPSSEVPVDLLTSSASGLDPHISPASAEFQLPRVAKWRKMQPDSLRALIQKHTETRQWGVLGEPRVNVLMLNKELDEIHPSSREGSE